MRKGGSTATETPTNDGEQPPKETSGEAASSSQATHLRFTIRFSGANGNVETASVDSTSRVEALTWTHVAACFDGTDIAIYVDGVHERSVTLPEGAGPIVTLPGEVLVGSKDFSGHVAEAGVYNSSLAAEQVAALYLNG